MAPSPVTIHPLQRDDSLDDFVDVPEPAARTVLPADVKIATELDFNDCDRVALLKKRNYEVHMCVITIRNMFRPTVIVHNTGAGLNLVQTS